MHSSVSLAAVFALPLVQLASAHGHVSSVSVNGGSRIQTANPNWYYLPVDQRQNTPGWRAMNQDNGFVEPSAFGTNDIACHKSATPGQTYIEANAGDKLTIYWDTWPESHRGPILNYLAPCSGECTSASAGSLSFTKITEGALISGSNPGNWVTDTLIRNNFASDLTIPRNLAAGNYVLRHEIIALHAAGQQNGAQAYPQCLNLKIKSGGSRQLSGGTPGRSLYSATHPGIIFSLYQQFSSYSIPGPSVQNLRTCCRLPSSTSLLSRAAESQQKTNIKPHGQAAVPPAASWPRRPRLRLRSRRISPLAIFEAFDAAAPEAEFRVFEGGHTGRGDRFRVDRSHGMSGPGGSRRVRLAWDLCPSFTTLYSCP
ncbi:hypothetical protein RB595_008358 [Gaeumannomyces hyphopodioides]